jgi:hypothetical protein
LSYQALEALENIIVEKSLNTSMRENIHFVLKNILGKALVVVLPDYFDLILSIIRVYPLQIAKQNEQVI